jgi:hypothetical protein
MNARAVLIKGSFSSDYEYEIRQAKRTLIHRLSMYRCVTSVKMLSHGRHLPDLPSSVARVIIHLVIRLAFKNAFNTISTTLIAFNNFKHSTLIV